MKNNLIYLNGIPLIPVKATLIFSLIPSMLFVLFGLLIGISPALAKDRKGLAATNGVRLSDYKKVGLPFNGKAVRTDTATFASGCFWCGEAKFSQLKGVLKVTSGFTGGHVANPSYELVCTGETGHAEAINIVYDPSLISFEGLLEAFFMSHDPTQLNRQGNDIGTQYRSAIYYHNEEQKQQVENTIRKLNDQKIYPKPVVTEVTHFSVFYKAENYHQAYYKSNPNQGYCRYVIQPELEKFKKIFKDKLKP